MDEGIMQNHIKSKLRFVSLSVITLTYFFVQHHSTFSSVVFWGLTLTGWMIGVVVYTWKGKKAEMFLASKEQMLRVLDFIFVLGYMWVTGGVDESPYLILIYLGIASVGLYDEKRVGVLYSFLAVIVLIVYDCGYTYIYEGQWRTSTNALSHIFMLPVFGVMANLLISHFQRIKKEEQIVLDELVTSLAKAIGSKDSYTLGHSTRVQLYSLALGKELGLNQDDMFTLKYGALLHDIGKIHIPSTVLNKTGKLTEEEWLELKGHSLEGARIVGGLKKLKGVRDIILYHHEKYNGQGYPHGLKGEEIPLLAAIVNVADSFDAMTSSRSYNTPKSIEEGMAEIKRCTGTQFHPKVAEAALSLYQRGRWPQPKQTARCENEEFAYERDEEEI
jgi:putative nucleotidyltransferase with HDIG domain